MVVVVTGLGATVATGVDTEMMVVMSERAVRVTVEVAKGDLTGFSANLVEHLTRVEVDTPAVNVNAWFGTWLNNMRTTSA